MCFSLKTKQNEAWYVIKNWLSSYCRSNFIKYVGVIIDDKLNWRDHVSFVCRKVARGLGVIMKAKEVLQKEYLISLYNSFIYLYLIHCNQIWGSDCKTNIDPCLFYIRGPLFWQLKLLNYENIFKYVAGRRPRPIPEVSEAWHWLRIWKSEAKIFEITIDMLCYLKSCH